MFLSGTTRSISRRTTDFDNPEKELFIWAILLNRRELAHLFWKMGKDQVGESTFLISALKGKIQAKSVDLWV